MSKPIWKSKTLLLCGLAAVLVVIQYATGVAWIPPEVQAVIGFLGAAILRFLTNEGVVIPGVTDQTT